MAKQTRSLKGVDLQNHQGKGTSYEHHESFDDSLLPDSVELAKLKELDPNIIEWIKERTAKEQDSRLDFNSRKMSIIEASQVKLFFIDVLAILSALTVSCAGMWFSYLLINKDQTLTGSIFAGGTILLAANSFLSFRKNKNTPTASVPKKHE